jgi:hypothetical protein
VIGPALALALLAAAHATRRALRLNIAATVTARLIGSANGITGAEVARPATARE